MIYILQPITEPSQYISAACQQSFRPLYWASSKALSRALTKALRGRPLRPPCILHTLFTIQLIHQVGRGAVKPLVELLVKLLQSFIQRFYRQSSMQSSVYFPLALAKLQASIQLQSLQSLLLRPIQPARGCKVDILDACRVLYNSIYLYL